MIYTTNEWSPLRKVILGTSRNMNWPWRNIPRFPRGPVDSRIIEETEEDLENFRQTLESTGVEVVRPADQDYCELGGFGAYSVRDTVLIIGSKVFFTPTYFKERRLEWHALKHLVDEGNVIPAAGDPVMFDAANVIRMDDRVLYLVSQSGNRAGARWLQSKLGNCYVVHEIRDMYAGHHLDTTVVPLREGLVMLNSERVIEDRLPDFMASWDKIWITKDDIIEDHANTNIASPWMAMNVLSVAPDTVIMDARQIHIAEKLKAHDIRILPVTLRHSRHLLGGHHCTTLDLLRG